MSPEEFRSNGILRQRLAELLLDPVMQQALVIALDLGLAPDPPLGADSLWSVRALSQQNGWNAGLRSLQVLASPMQTEHVEIEETWEKPENTP